MIETTLQSIHNIKDFKVVYICPDHNEKYHTRKAHMDDLLTAKGFKDVVHYKSGNERYPRCLAVANKEILKQYLDTPILILEDDVEMTQVMEFTIPEGADAIYFGLSVCASHPTEGYNVYYAQFQSHTADQVKVINMLGTQAILYLSRRYKEAAIKAMDTCIEKGGFNDIALSRIQPQFNIYANKVPTFYQSNKFNQIEQGFDVEKATKITINNNLSISFGIIPN